MVVLAKTSADRVPTKLEGFKSGYARHGEANGRTRLTDEMVRMAREFRAYWDNRPSYAELSRIFGVNPKYLREICVGAVRPEAGGPIENPFSIRKSADEQGDERDNQGDDGEAMLPGFDVRYVIRCEWCGSRSHPSIERPKLCLKCHLYGYDE